MYKDWLDFDENWEWAVKFYLRIFRHAIWFLCFLLSPKIVGAIIVFSFTLWLKIRKREKDRKEAELFAQQHPYDPTKDIRS